MALSNAVKWWVVHFKLESFYSKLPTKEAQDALDSLLQETEYFARFYEDIEREQRMDRYVDEAWERRRKKEAP